MPSEVTIGDVEVTGPVVGSAVILAGGLGTRLRSAVPDLPKPMAPIKGRPFLEHQIDYWMTQGVGEFVLSVGYRSEVIIRHFGSSYRGSSIRYAIEEHPLGTGGGLFLAAAQLTGERPFLVLNGDTFFDVRLSDLARFHAAQGSAWTFSLFRSDDTNRYMGMDVASSGRIMTLRSRHPSAVERLANGGVYLVEPAALAASGFAPGTRFSLEDDLLSSMLSAGTMMYGLCCDGRFIDIGIPEDYFRAGELLST